MKNQKEKVTKLKPKEKETKTNGKYPNQDLVSSSYIFTYMNL